MGDRRPENPADHWLPLPAEHYFDKLRDSGFELPEGWLDAAEPAGLSTLIYAEHGQEDLERLADRAATTAVDEIGTAYRSPFVVAAARNAARLALGLKEMPNQEEADD